MVSGKGLHENNKDNTLTVTLDIYTNTLPTFNMASKETESERRKRERESESSVSSVGELDQSKDSDKHAVNNVISRNPMLLI